MITGDREGRPSTFLLDVRLTREYLLAMRHVTCCLLPREQRLPYTLVYPWRLVPAQYLRWRAFFLQTVTHSWSECEEWVMTECLTVHRTSLWWPPRPREYEIWGWKTVEVRKRKRIILWKFYFLYMTWCCIREHTAAMVSCIRPVLDWALSYFIMDGEGLLYCYR